MVCLLFCWCIFHLIPHSQGTAGVFTVQPTGTVGVAEEESYVFECIFSFSIMNAEGNWTLTDSNSTKVVISNDTTLPDGTVANITLTNTVSTTIYNLSLSNIQRKWNGSSIMCSLDEGGFIVSSSSATILVYWLVELASRTYDKSVTVGDSFSVNFDITDPGNPEVAPTWTYNGTSLVENSRVTITADGLQFSNIEKEDIGTYVATFNNSAGDTTFTVTLSPNSGLPIQATLTMIAMFLAVAMVILA